MFILFPIDSIGRISFHNVAQATGNGLDCGQAHICWRGYSQLIWVWINAESAKLQFGMLQFGGSRNWRSTKHGVMQNYKRQTLEVY